MKELEDRVEENSHKGGEKDNGLKNRKKYLKNQHTASGYPISQ